MDPTQTASDGTCPRVTMPYKKSQIPDFRKAATRAQVKARRTLESAVREFADRELQAFKLRILDQDFESFVAHPLSPRYVERKRRAGADTRTMIATGHYLRSMRVFEQPNPDRSTTIYVGFDEETNARDLQGRETDIKLIEVARIQEYGALLNPESGASIPPRPHWGPHLKDMKRRAVEERKQIRQNIRRVLRDKMGI